MPSILLLLLACQTGDPALPSDDSGAPSADTLELVPLSDAALLRRLSLDLRGVLPTAAELAELAGSDGATPLDRFIDDFLADPRLETRLTELLAERWLTRTDEFKLDIEGLQLPPDQEFPLERSIGEEAPRLAAHLIAADAPWSDLVTTDRTQANNMLLSIYPLDPLVEPADDSDWVDATYVDGRPALGVLATNSMWLRYETSPNNLGRHRAAAVSRLFLCSDFLSRPVSFSSEGLLDGDALEEAIHNDPACIACHVSLDPLASAFFGWWWLDRADISEITTYHPERESLGSYYLDVEPGWFGAPVDDLDDLGGLVADDPRFASCAVETMAELLLRRQLSLDDQAWTTSVLDDFLATELSAHNLLRSVVSSPEYAAGDARGPDAQVERIATRRLLSSTQWVSVVADLSGLAWTWEGFSQLENDDLGFRIILGGIDGDTVTRVAELPSIGTLVAIRRVAQAAASAAVERDLVEGGVAEEAALLDRVDLDSRPGEAAFDEQLVALHLRLYAEAPDAEALAADSALWTQVEAIDGPAAAWRSLLSVMLRDPRFWTY